jgi:hypothetical protein
MIVLEVQKFMKCSKLDLNNRLHQWMRFFAEPDYFKHLPIQLKSNHPNLLKAAIILDESKLTPRQRYTYDVYMDHIRCWNTEVMDSFKQGRLELGQSSAGDFYCSQLVFLPRPSALPRPSVLPRPLS